MPQPPRKMAVGFNHNVRYRGRVYHVQTEDSGVENPNIVSHLFAGGNVVASKKRSYSHLLSADDLALRVRELMEAQHKELLRNLIAGAFDRNGGADAARAFQPGEVESARELTPPPATSPVAALFADDLTSERSLDEVILRYLADQAGAK